MYNQTLHGIHTYCGNRQCKHPFTKDSFLGYLPKSETTVYVVMKCAKCNDVFAISMATSYAKTYYMHLPRRNKSDNGPITLHEIYNVKKKLHTLNGFDDLQSVNVKDTI